MISRPHRLSRTAFKTLRSPKSISGEHLSLSLYPSQEGGCAVVVSKKVLRRSVDRHLIKRRILSIARPWCKGPHAIVVYAKKGVLAVSFKDLSQELQGLYSKIT